MAMELPQYAASFGAWGVVTAVVIGIFLLKLFSSKHKNLPPGPRGLPIIGALHLLGKYPYQDLAKLAETYGPVMSLWFGQKLTVVASSPAAAEEFFKTQDTNFSSRPKTSFGTLVVPNDVVLTPDTPARRHLKKIIHMQLSTTRKLQLSESIRTDEIAHVLSAIPQDGTTAVPVRTHIEVVITNILTRMILKKRFTAVSGKGGEGQELEGVRHFRMLLEEMAECNLRINPGDFIPIFGLVDFQGLKRQYRNLKERMDVFMLKIVTEHLVQRKNGELEEKEKDMVDMLLDQTEDKTLKFNITDQHINGALWNTFIGGTSTSTDAIEWAMAECIRNPHVMKKAQAELDTVVGKSRRVEDADIPNLKYLQSIVKETFRLHLSPPLLLPHENETACKVFGYDIPAGTMVFVNAGSIARDPSIWEDPMEFKPERFLDGMPHADTNVLGKHFELLPFGSGRRSCPGMALGIAMVNIMTATLLQSFDWSLPGDLQPLDLDMSEAETVETRRAQTLIAIPKARLEVPLIVN